MRRLLILAMLLPGLAWADMMTHATDCRGLTCGNVQGGQECHEIDSDNIYICDGAGAVWHLVSPLEIPAGFSLGTMTNGTTNTVIGYIDETPAGEWVATTNITSATDTSIFRVGSASLRLTVGSSPANGNGADNTLSNEDWTADESFGFWMRCDQTTAAGEWVLEITDSGAGATEENIPALATANRWIWLEVNIGNVADASKDVITTIGLDLSGTGATAFASGGICHFDFANKWDFPDEETLGIAIVEDGVVAVYTLVTTTGTDRTPLLLVDGTNSFIHYESGNDSIVTITDQSATSGWGWAVEE